ncbi:MAG: hypothetical protein HC830_11840 [Bacteroidetes bacterium]|nr:hypothetical protein [Bacteroidota bacterium]
MKELLQSTIEQLRLHVMKNLELVRENEREIKEMLQEPVSVSRARTLTEKYNFSKKVLAENNDFINLQLSVINFIYKYKDLWGQEAVLVEVEKSVPVEISREECFQLTVESRMDFGPDHPYFNDEGFFGNLLEYYQLQENYEKM